MQKFSRIKKLIVGFSLSMLVIGGGYFYVTSPHGSSAPPESAEGLLGRADKLAWNNRWAEARPLYGRAEELFKSQNQPANALYAHVSRFPPDEATSVRKRIGELTEDLDRPEAKDPETALRILTIRGMFETNYDAAQARSTWAEIRTRALSLRHVALASRAVGEEGIAAFMLGDTETAKKQVIRAWGLSKVERDPAATVRYASVFGAGLVQLHRYKEALTPLDQAIDIAKAHELAYPTIAVYAKIDALAGLHQYDQALTLVNQSLDRLDGTPYEGHKVQLYTSRGNIERDGGQWKLAVADYQTAVQLSTRTENYRGITDAAGSLARAYERTGDLSAALQSIDLAISANTYIPEELFLVPRNLAIKAEIRDRMGDHQSADALYRKSIALVDVMVQHAATSNIQRQLLAEMSDIYSGYFASLCTQSRYDEALQTLERVRGRVEAEALQHRGGQPIHSPTPEERELTRLNIALINTEGTGARQALTNAIYSTELEISPSSLTNQTVTHPVKLRELQRRLGPEALLIEYVLAEPTSYALAVTRNSVTTYPLPAKSVIESDANRYRKSLRSQKDDRELAGRLFVEVLGPIKEYRQKTDLILVLDGALHLLPFSALTDHAGYVLKTHTVDVEPSSTVYDLLMKRREGREPATMPYVGVAAWTQSADTRNAIVRAVTGPQRSQLVPLPDSKKEVEAIASDLPHPSTILEGADATEGHFKQIAEQSSDVVHLALHGYADVDYPDRSALVFAPEQRPNGEDGLLQVREIRGLHLNTRLVTLSACNTGVGPVGQAGVANLVNAFIEAGADSVVSTLWEVEDRTSSRLMTVFYSALATHKRKVDALRDAQLDLLDQGLSPYYWASFQIVGEPDGIL